MSYPFYNHNDPNTLTEQYPTLSGGAAELLVGSGLGMPEIREALDRATAVSDDHILPVDAQEIVAALKGEEQ